MVRTLVIKFPDFENKYTSRCIIAEVSVTWFQLSVEIRTGRALSDVQFCVSVICILKRI
jgi:hypothetical protein